MLRRVILQIAGVYFTLGAMAFAVSPDQPRSKAPDPAGPPHASRRSLTSPQKGLALLAAADGVDVHWNEQLGTPRTIRGRQLEGRKSFSSGRGVPAASRRLPGGDALAVMDNLSGLFAIEDVAAVLAHEREVSDEIGSRHVRLQQRADGLRVVGGEVMVHFDSNQQAYEVNGRFIPGIAVDSSKALPVETALRIARDSPQWGWILHDGEILADPELVVWALDNTPLPAWECSVMVTDPKSGSGPWRLWIDAANGTIIQAYSDLKKVNAPFEGNDATVNGSLLSGEGGGPVSITAWRESNGLHYLYSNPYLWFVFNAALSGYGDSNTYAHRNSSAWGTSDRVEMSASYNMDRIQRYFRQRHGRSSYDGFNAIMQVTVHYGSRFVNAYWDGQSCTFGDGDGVEANPLAVLDICAHEYTHAITDNSAGLIYQNESGALSESFSDIFGACVEFYAQPDGRGIYPDKTPGYADWLCGEDAWLSSKALRDMRNPHNTITVGAGNELPSRYKGTYWYFGSGDNGGVHYNSAVQNFFFYLLCEGGSGSNDGIAYSLTGIGVTNAERIAYRALTVYCGAYTDYLGVREAWDSAAKDLNADWSVKVNAAWDAVGVGASPQTVAAPVITPPGGACALAVTVTVTCATGGASIRYTLDDSEPSGSSALYSVPLVLTNTVTLKAKAFKSGLSASVTTVASYVFLGTILFNFPLDISPGWSCGGQWAYGVPSGGGGEHGYPDPVSGYTGAAVYGYNLGGDYSNAMTTTEWLTTGPINLANASNVKLVFRRWLGVERPVFDHAYLEVSANGTVWTRIWENSAEVTDGTWVQAVYDISPVADRQSSVRIRWGMGPTDESWRYGGWTIDDVEVWGQTVPLAIPQTPNPLAASVVNATRVHLFWHDHSSDEQGFTIERRLSTNAWSFLANVGANVSTYDDNTVVSNTLYGYRVKAFNPSGSSPYSNEAQVTTPANSSGDVWDPIDDSGPGATAVPSPVIMPQTHGPHVLGNSDTYDWFKIYLAAGTAVNVTTSGGSGDTYAELFSDELGETRLAYDDDSGGNLQFSLSYAPPATGWYYIRIRTFSAGEAASFTLSYHVTADTSAMLGEGMDAPQYQWMTDSNNGWVAQGIVTHDNVDAIQSASISDNQYSLVRTLVQGPGVAGFWWRVSSEDGYDELQFFVGDLKRAAMSGESGWIYRTFQIPPGQHLLTWMYIKDKSLSSGSDAGWVDHFSFQSRSSAACNDFDGDRRSDLAVFYPPSGYWYLHSLTNGPLAFPATWGFRGSTAQSGDYTGDGIADLGIYDPLSGLWYLRTLSGSVLQWQAPWGFAGTQSVAGDFDGDGRQDMAIYSQATGSWYIRSVAGQILAFPAAWGFKGAVPVPGDYNDDGITDLAVYYPPSGQWYIRTLSGTVIRNGLQWGFKGTVAVPGDYDGDGVFDLAVFYPPTAQWYILSLDGRVLVYNRTWGALNGVAVSGDYDGDGRSDLTVYSRQTGRWSSQTTTGTVIFTNLQWGFNGAVPIQP